MIIALDHVQLAMPRDGEEAAREYYGRLLGLPELTKPEALRGRGGVWFVIADGRQLHLGVEEPFVPSKKAHPCFVTNAFVELRNKLQAAGYEVRDDDLVLPIRRFYTSDVFNNRLEIADRTSM